MEVENDTTVVLDKIVDRVRRNIEHKDIWRIFFENNGVDVNNYWRDWWDISKDQDNDRNKQWWESLNNEDREEYRRRILHYTFPRKVKVYKDMYEKKEAIDEWSMEEGVEEDGKEDGKEDEKGGKYRLHREYEEDDTVLNAILRHKKWNKWSVLKDRFGEISRSYMASRKLYNIVRNTSRYDNVWKKFMKECCKLRRGQHKQCKLTPGEDGYRLVDYGEDSERVDYVFCIPHTTGDGRNRDDSILTLAARKNPPLLVVTTILNFCRKAISYVDDPEWDCIPLNYAIQYHASPEVVEALIPKKDDIEKFKPLQDFDFLNSRNLHYRTPLHWAAYHDAPIGTIRVLKEHCKDNVLHKLDHCKLNPMETAIWHGRSTDKIKEFFVPDLKGSTVFEDVLVKLIRSMIYDENPFKYSKYDPFGESDCYNLCDSFISNPRILRKPSDDTDKDKGDQYPLEYGEKATSTLDYHMHSISRSISRSKNLQKILSDKASCRLPTAVKLADLYICVVLIVSYTLCTLRVLDTGRDISNTPLAYLLMGAVLYMSVREFVELMVGNANWFFSIWNYFDVLTIVLVWYSFNRMLDIEPVDLVPDTKSRNRFGLLTIITATCIWFNTIVILRSTYMSFAILVSGTFRIFRRLIPFIVWSSLILLMFGQIFSLESLVYNRCESTSHVNSSIEPDFCTFENSILATFSLFIGNMEFEKLLKREEISILFWIVAVLVLQNIVIAIVTEAWQEILRVSEQVFWEHRLDFLMSVKDYENFYTCGFKYSPSSLFEWSKVYRKKYEEDNENVLSEWLRPLWPGKRYMGFYESMSNRIFSNGVGSLRWQVVYECRSSTEEIQNHWGKDIKKRCLVLIKAFLLLLLVFIVTVVSFVMGLATLGLLWPKEMREFIFGLLLEADEDNSVSEVDEESKDSYVNEEKSTCKSYSRTKPVVTECKDNQLV